MKTISMLALAFSLRKLSVLYLCGRDEFTYLLILFLDRQAHFLFGQHSSLRSSVIIIDEMIT